MNFGRGLRDIVEALLDGFFAPLYELAAASLILVLLKVMNVITKAGVLSFVEMLGILIVVMVAINFVARVLFSFKGTRYGIAYIVGVVAGLCLFGDVVSNTGLPYATNFTMLYLTSAVVGLAARLYFEFEKEKRRERKIKWYR
ncbi:MAG: hypothetical protein M1122_02870 [Candidatus Marsarchaeota archaeon]|jgi:hypothetical protein|nr:hypothetical protein [Candidatus Marsarchaeota archaeon]